MTTTAQIVSLFEEHIREYEKWFRDHPSILDSEVAAFRELLPEGEIQGIEIGSGAGHLALALGLKEGVEPSEVLRNISIERGLEAIAGRAEEIPFKDMHFDFVLLATALHYIQDIDRAFREAHRVLKPLGCFIIGFIDQESILGKEYLSRRKQSTFYRDARFYKIETLEQKLKQAGFKAFSIYQTLFGLTNEIRHTQKMIPGIGLGSFILIKAEKN
jgi:SAM-dependent methyltransferase